MEGIATNAVIAVPDEKYGEVSIARRTVFTTASLGEMKEQMASVEQLKCCRYFVTIWLAR